MPRLCQQRLFARILRELSIGQCADVVEFTGIPQRSFKVSEHNRGLVICAQTSCAYCDRLRHAIIKRLAEEYAPKVL